MGGTRLISAPGVNQKTHLGVGAMFNIMPLICTEPRSLSGWRVIFWFFSKCLAVACWRWNRLIERLSFVSKPHFEVEANLSHLLPQFFKPATFDLRAGSWVGAPNMLLSSQVRLAHQTSKPHFQTRVWAKWKKTPTGMLLRCSAPNINNIYVWTYWKNIQTYHDSCSSWFAGIADNRITGSASLPMQIHQFRSHRWCQSCCVH